MPSPTPLRQPFPGLYILHGEGNEVSGYTALLKRPEGNFLVYNGGTLEDMQDAITGLGGMTGLFINDRHNAKVSKIGDVTALCEHFEAQFYASEIEATAGAIKSCPVLTALPYEQQMFAPDFEVIPLPGHTPGNLAYLWKSPKHKILFIGDTLVHDNGEWKFWVSKPNTKTMILGLEMLKETNFDAIVSTSFGCRGGHVFSLTAKTKIELLDGVIAGLIKKGSGS